MKKTALSLALYLGVIGTLAAQVVFRHVSTSANTRGHITTLDHPQLNGNPNAILFILPNYNLNGAEATGVDYLHNAGVWYNGSRWTIFNQNTKQAMPLSMTFNVLVAPPGNPNCFTVSATQANIAAHGAPNGMQIDHPAANGKTNAMLLVTQNWSNVYNDASQLVIYSNGKWSISNNGYMAYWRGETTDRRGLMPVGARFNVMVIENGSVPGLPGAQAFLHTARKDNITNPHITFLNHTGLTGNRDAILFAAAYWGHADADRTNPQQAAGPYNEGPLVSWYDHPNDPWKYRDNAWSLYNGNSAPMPEGAKMFVVTVNAGAAQPIPNLTGFYRADNGDCGQAYIRQIGNNIYWFGEHPNGSFGHVFSGTISGNTITGNLWDVPKGNLLNRGNSVYTVSADGNTLTRSGGSIGCNVLVKGALPVALPASRPMQPGSGALTGIWDCNDGASTYVREDGSNFLFFSEAKNNGTRPGFANIYIGTRNGNTITGSWVDVPKGTHLGNGAMTLRVENDTRFVRADAGNGYGGSVWTRGSVSNENTGVILNPNIGTVLGNIQVLPLTGFVDMHTHPMARWGFGEELFWGENDGNPAAALGRCACFHRGYDFLSNQCGNNYREAIVNKTDIAGHHTMGGCFPTFEAWPKYNAVLHQQMWVDWIKRAYEGGLRVMVALTVNSHCIADAAETKGPNDDLRSMNIQIQKLKEFVGRHDFMEMAYTPADLRRIVRANKLAIVLGIEMDNIGNFYNPADGKGGAYKANPGEADIRAEIDRLFDLGVRYIFPIHLTNNAFGGAAIYVKDFNVPNKYNTGSPFAPESVDSRTSGITFKLHHPYTDLGGDYSFAASFTGDILPGHIMPHRLENYPNYPDPGLNRGHRNSLGLTDGGRFAIKYMMQKGMMIDIDHCSEKAVDIILAMAQTFEYPVNSGHNGPRGDSGNENNRTDEQYRAIQRLGGMIGLGHGGGAKNFLETYRKVLSIINVRSQVCIGTDVNGMFPLPGPPQTGEERITYGSQLTPCTMGTKTWDFNTEGFAHYGLFPDYIQSMKNAGMTAEEERVFFSSAEYFAQMWRKCERQKSQVR